MIEVIRRVIASEGLASALRRGQGRIAEATQEAAMLARGAFTRTLPQFPILNVLPTPATARLGGIQIHLIARLAAERAMRPVALYTPGLLTLSRPREHARRVKSLAEAIAITGARWLHLEGAYGLDLDDVAAQQRDVILSIHDFTAYGDLLHSARAVIYPSRFLERFHGRAGTIIPAAIPATPRPQRTRTKHAPRIAFAGSVVTRKGAELIEPVIDALRGRGIEWLVFGGGRADVLRALRTHRDVYVHGHYAMGALPSLLGQHDVDVVLLVSTEPETYSLALSESWLAGVPVIAFAHGAIEERVHAHGGGWLVPLDQGVRGMAHAVDRFLHGERLPATPPHIEFAGDAARAVLALYDALADPTDCVS